MKKVDNAVIRKIKESGSLKEALKGCHSKKKKLIGLTSYDILDNHSYQVRFQYVPAYLEDHSSDEEEEGHHHDGGGDKKDEKEESAAEMDEFVKQPKGQSDYVLR